MRLHLRDGNDVIVREAVVSADSIVGVPWGSVPKGARIAVARAQVERLDVGETNQVRTVFLLLGILGVTLGTLSWLVRRSYTT